jgi:iron complex transport system ATP-binding protein
MTHTLQTHQLTLAYDALAIIEKLSIDLPLRQITALVGPNGCGKSTLLRGLARLLKPKQGAVYLNGRSIHQMPTKKLAQELGILPQSPMTPEGLTVHELVAQGRYPHQSWFQQWSLEDERMTGQALAITGMSELANQPVDALSGGQRQRAWIAMTLAQNTPIILLDEPTTFLDIAHQIEVFHLLERLNREDGRTIVMVVHDLNLAARYAHHLIAMRDGQIVTAGTPTQVITPDLLSQVFGVKASIALDPHTHTPFCIPYALHVPEAESLPTPVNGHHTLKTTSGNYLFSEPFLMEK